MCQGYSHFSGFLHHFILAKLATSSIRVNCSLSKFVYLFTFSSGDECTGCRRSKQTERPYCFEVIIAGGSILQLAAPNETEAQDWLLALCQTVAEGQQVRILEF